MMIGLCAMQLYDDIGVDAAYLTDETFFDPRLGGDSMRTTRPTTEPWLSVTTDTTRSVRAWIVQYNQTFLRN